MLTEPSGEPGSTGRARAEHTVEETAHSLCRVVRRLPTYVERVGAHQVGYLVRGRRRTRPWRPLRVPLLRIVVEPGGSIDFAHPELGFHGHHRQPPARRALKLWDDELVSISHGDDWMFVIDSPVPFDRRWLALLTGSSRCRAAPGLAVVFASFAGLARPGPFRVPDVDPTTYTTLVHVEDHRRST